MGPQSEVLEHHIQISFFDGDDFVGGSDFHTVQQNMPAVDGKNPSDDVQKCRLPAAGGAQHRDDLSFLDIQGNTLQDFFFSVVFMNLIEFQNRFHRILVTPSLPFSY